MKALVDPNFLTKTHAGSPSGSPIGADAEEAKEVLLEKMLDRQRGIAYHLYCHFVYVFALHYEQLGYNLREIGRKSLVA